MEEKIAECVTCLNPAPIHLVDIGQGPKWFYERHADGKGIVSVTEPHCPMSYRRVPEDKCPQN